LCVSASRAGCRNRETVILCQGLEGMLPADVAPTGAFGVADHKQVRRWCLPGLLSLSAATIAATTQPAHTFFNRALRCTTDVLSQVHFITTMP